MIETISKHGPIFQYQKNDPLYYGSNKMQFDRGAYARPWPFIEILSGYLQQQISPASTLSVNIRYCDGFGIIPGLGGNDGATDLGDGLVKWEVSPFQFPLNVGFFLEILGMTGGDYDEVELYANDNAVTSSASNISGTGMLIRVLENTRLKRADVPMNITTCTGPITYDLYHVNPKNLTDRTLVFTGSTSAYIGMTGAIIASLDLDDGGTGSDTHGVAWNPGDLLILTVTQTGGDVITSNQTDASNGGVYFIEGVGFFPFISLDWTIYGYDVVYSELLVMQNDPLLQIRYSNDATYDAIPAETELATWIRGNFWEPDYPAEMEDVEILPGEFTRVRNEQHRTKKLETDFMPGYRHEHMEAILTCDNLNLEGTDIIMREPYQKTFNNRHYGLAKGNVILTERPSILRNVR